MTQEAGIHRAANGDVKAWISYATFEAEPIPVPRAMRKEEEEGDAVRARQVFEKGYKDLNLKSKGLKHECVVLLEIWKAFEEKYGTAEGVVKVQGMMPITSKRRVVDKEAETGQTVEDWDIVFADDESEPNPTSFKFLQMAHAQDLKDRLISC